MFIFFPWNLYIGKNRGENISGSLPRLCLYGNMQWTTEASRACWRLNMKASCRGTLYEKRASYVQYGGIRHQNVLFGTKIFENKKLWLFTYLVERRCWVACDVGYVLSLRKDISMKGGRFWLFIQKVCPPQKFYFSSKRNIFAHLILLKYRESVHFVNR